MSVIGSAATTIQRTSASALKSSTELPERVGVGEEQRGVEAEQHQARDARALRVPLDVVVALQAVDANQLGGVRRPGAADERQQ